MTLEDTNKIPSSLDEIRKLTSEFEGKGSLEGAEKSVRQDWIKKVLKTFGYEHLPREDKGALRQFIQNETGYSRAQSTRIISESLKANAKEVLEVVASPKHTVNI